MKKKTTAGKVKRGTAAAVPRAGAGASAGRG